MQTARLVATIRALDPDIAALMELENDGYGPDSSIAQFVESLNADGSRWRFVDAGRGPGHDDIRVGLIYRFDRVSPVGARRCWRAVHSALAAACRWRRHSAAATASPW